MPLYFLSHYHICCFSRCHLLQLSCLFSMNIPCYMCTALFLTDKTSQLVLLCYRHTMLHLSCTTWYCWGMSWNIYNAALTSFRKTRTGHLRRRLILSLFQVNVSSSLCFSFFNWKLKISNDSSSLCFSFIH